MRHWPGSLAQDPDDPSVSLCPIQLAALGLLKGWEGSQRGTVELDVWEAADPAPPEEHIQISAPGVKIRTLSAILFYEGQDGSRAKIWLSGMSISFNRGEGLGTT